MFVNEKGRGVCLDARSSSLAAGYSISRKGVHNMENFHIKGSYNFASSARTHTHSHEIYAFHSNIHQCIHELCITLHILHRFTFSPSMQN